MACVLDPTTGWWICPGTIMWDVTEELCNQKCSGGGSTDPWCCAMESAGVPVSLPDPCYSAPTGTCNGWYDSLHDSKAECEASCGGGDGCIDPWTGLPCACAADGYSCVSGLPGQWECDSIGGGCVLSPTGLYESQERCEFDCPGRGCEKKTGKCKTCKESCGEWWAAAVADCIAFNSENVVINGFDNTCDIHTSYHLDDCAWYCPTSPELSPRGWENNVDINLAKRGWYGSECGPGERPGYDCGKYEWANGGELCLELCMREGGTPTTPLGCIDTWTGLPCECALPATSPGFNMYSCKYNVPGLLGSNWIS